MMKFKKTAVIVGIILALLAFGIATIDSALSDKLTSTIIRVGEEVERTTGFNTEDASFIISILVALVIIAILLSAFYTILFVLGKLGGISQRQLPQGPPRYRNNFGIKKTI